MPAAKQTSIVDHESQRFSSVRGRLQCTMSNDMRWLSEHDQENICGIHAYVHYMRTSILIPKSLIIIRG